MTRPDAPLIEATTELLGSVKAPWYGVALYRYCLTPCFPVRGLDDEPMYDVRDESRVCNVPASSLLLDLRRPEVQDRWSRVRWGASGLELFPSDDGPIMIAGGAGLAAAPPIPGMMHVPALLDLPTTDTLAWACWHVEQAIRAEEARR